MLMKEAKLFQKTSTKSPTLFLDENALLGENPEFYPMRKKELDEIADAIRPLLENRKGENLFICGPNGSGKMSLMKYVLKRLAKENSRQN